MEWIDLSRPVIRQQAVTEIMKCNDDTVRFGLVLSPAEAAQLVESRNTALKNCGRIEFGGGVIEKIIRKFCDSPYISQFNYLETLQELTDMFYFYKNETLDMLGDDALLEFMKKCFDGKCQGSLELLKGRELANMARNLRYGSAADFRAAGLSDAGEDEDGEY